MTDTDADRVHPAASAPPPPVTGAGNGPAVRTRWPVMPVVVVGVLVLLNVALRVVMAHKALPAPLAGDEVSYTAGARALADSARALVQGDEVPTDELQARLVGNGWFMPGMPLLIAPLFLLDPAADDAAVRVYLGVLSTAVFLALVAVVARTVGWRTAAVLLVVPGLVPMYALFGSSAWGDGWAGLAILATVPLLVVMWRRLDADGVVRLRDAALLGLALVVALYLRSSTLPLVVAVLVLLVVVTLLRTRGRALARSLAACAVAVGVVVVLMAPWSAHMSRTFGEPVTTTTTMSLSLAYAFGDRDELCFGPCVEGNIWTNMARYARAVGEQTGENPLEVRRQMRDYAMRDVTPSGYAASVLDNFHRYAFSPASYDHVFRPPLEGVEKPPERAPDTVNITVTTWLYLGAVAVAAGALLVPRRVRSDAQVLVVTASLLLALLMSQPFVHVSSGRYWPVFVPLLGIAIAGLLAPADPAASSTALRRTQLVLAVGWVVVVGALFLVAG
ncbi:hypothetical protein [Isoptericola dokdonensis]|uniref:Glycosyltransferase RgtA/B/C/D-like domain-containing protein n=1 Tax=Isoptericola dokdonensis DS-3 TaxID=1300344 RepID=A0A161I7P8_9MICO|nr:hypothetical protein [Isoptericola dokdonensis]ANC31648.1 hypothetical protein I598_2107 [Isoptericola dokdonensis DS-3]